MSRPDELVLTVDGADVRDLFLSRGAREFLPAEAIPDLGEWLGQRAEFIRRSRAETLLTHRHIATYTIIRSRAKVFTYRRGTSGSERRLFDARSLGVGGHAMLEDFLGWEDLGPEVWVEGLDVAAEREVREEVESAWAISANRRFAGLIAGDETACDRVHLGYVALWETLASDDPIVPREGCLEAPEWMTVEELRASPLPLEPWSAIVLDRLLGPAAAPEARP